MWPCGPCELRENLIVKKGRWSIGLSIVAIMTGIAMYAWSEEQSASNIPLHPTASVTVGSLNETVVADLLYKAYAGELQ